MDFDLNSIKSFTEKMSERGVRPTTPSSTPKPLLKSEELSKRVDQVLEEWKQKRDNDCQTIDKIGDNLNKCFDRVMSVLKKTIDGSYADDSGVGQRLKRMEQILSEINKIEELFRKVENRFDVIRAMVYIPQQVNTSSEDSRL